jgi:arginine/lysine/ornithine decarboxylase
MPLTSAIEKHLSAEIASFHMPGHKGRFTGEDTLFRGGALWQWDVTELPGLDELSQPKGVLADLEARAARLWKSKHALISVNGASAGIVAAMLALVRFQNTDHEWPYAGGQNEMRVVRNKILIPRNSHRAVVNGLVLSGMYPIWYEPTWNERWQVWEAVAPSVIAPIIEKHKYELAGVLVVSPTYGGAVSDIAAVAQKCRAHNLPLIVDEAHGAHFLPGSVMPQSAIGLGADIVVHSLHKTAPALTQTGMVHVATDSRVPAHEIRAALNMLQSSSPSYLLMASIEQAIMEMEGDHGIARLAELVALGNQIHTAVAKLPGLAIYESAFANDPLRFLISAKNATAREFAEFIDAWGIWPETILGNGVLFMMGTHTTDTDIDCLKSALSDFTNTVILSDAKDPSSAANSSPEKYLPLEQVISPRKAFMSQSEVIPLSKAVGRIAAETIAPCPPGIPVVVAGQRISQELSARISLTSVRVLTE